MDNEVFVYYFKVDGESKLQMVAATTDNDAFQRINHYKNPLLVSVTETPKFENSEWASLIRA